MLRPDPYFFTVDFFPVSDKIWGGRLIMKGFFKSILALLSLASAFFLGFYLGKEKEKAKIPKFQDESDKTG
jgi:hypothetical protein